MHILNLHLDLSFHEVSKYSLSINFFFNEELYFKFKCHLKIPLDIPLHTRKEPTYESRSSQRFRYYIFRP